MTTRKEVLNQLKIDLAKIQTPNYLSDIEEIVHGIVSFDQVLARPFLGYFMPGDEVTEEYMSNERQRSMSIVIYGYADTNLNNFDPIYDLAEDLEKFLYSSDWTYTDITLLGDIVIQTGGIENEKSVFDLEIRIIYDQTL